MQFNLIAFIFNPLVLLFATMALGNLFGELKFRKFKFGITGTLFIGLGIGYFLTRYAATFAKGSKYYASAMKVMQGKVIDGSLMNLALLIFIVGTRSFPIIFYQPPIRLIFLAAFTSAASISVVFVSVVFVYVTALSLKL